MINLFQPSVNNDSLKYLKKIFKKKLFYKNQYYKSFLNKFSNFQNVKSNKIIFGASCSDLIFNIMFTCKNIIKKKIVIVPSNSFPAIPSAVIRAGLNLKIIDIDKNTGNINLESLKKLNKSQIGCIFLTHYGGIPVDIKKLKKIVSKNTLIFEDCAGALGSFYEDNTSLGSKADFSCWSFDPMKLITCGEGGAALIKNKHIFNKFSENLYLGYKSNRQSGYLLAKNKRRWWEYQLMSFGTRSVFTEINAAIGLSQIVKIKSILKKKNILRKYYEKHLSNQKNVKLIENINGKNYSNYFLTIFAKNRNGLAKFLYERKIYTSVRYYPLNKISIFKKFIDKKEKFNNSEFFEKNALNLPIHHDLRIKDLKKIISHINLFYK